MFLNHKGGMFFIQRWLVQGPRVWSFVILGVFVTRRDTSKITHYFYPLFILDFIESQTYREKPRVCSSVKHEFIPDLNFKGGEKESCNGSQNSQFRSFQCFESWKESAGKKHKSILKNVKKKCFALIWLIIVNELYWLLQILLVPYCYVYTRLHTVLFHHRLSQNFHQPSSVIFLLCDSCLSWLFA